MQSVKIASIAGIVKRPSPDESQPKRVLLPGKAPIPSNISRGGLDVELPFSVFPAIFLLFFCKSIIVLPTDSLFRCLHLLYQRPVVLKTLRSLTWSVLCACLLVNSRYVLFLRERENLKAGLRQMLLEMVQPANSESQKKLEHHTGAATQN